MTTKKFEKIKKYYEPLVLTKPRGTKHYLVWWESGDDYFLNITFTNKTIPNPRDSHWITRNDVPRFFNRLKREGYTVQ